ncbi:MAG: DUF2339 domain-containing protein [Candidatus Hydrogenedentota bacterium]
MNPEKRIEELERELHALREELGRGTQEAEAVETGDAETGASPAAPDQSLIDDMRQRVDRALKNNGDGSIESVIGAVWLSRLAVVVMMTAFALAARATLQDWDLGAERKVALGYAVAVVFTAYGLLVRRRSDLFAQAVAACGLASFYFTTYAAFFVPEMRIAFLAGSPWAIPALLMCLGVLSAVAQWRRSPTIAGVGLFLAYYTVLVSCTGESTSLTELAYALLTCTVLAAVTLGFYIVNRWVAFSWAALIATHTAFYFFIYRQPAGLNIGALPYFWVSTGFLTVCYILFAVGFLIDAYRQGDYRRRVAPMSGVNSFIYFALMWFAIRASYPESEWLFRSAFAVLLVWLAALARIAGPRRNYLFQVFAAKAIIMVTLALEAYLSSEKLLVVLAIEALALGISHWRSGIVAFKALGLVLMLVTTATAMLHLRVPGTIEIAGYAMPANWFGAAGVTAVFVLSASFYENFVRRVPAHDRHYRSQWLLADSWLDLPPQIMAMFYAVAAALILLSITIVDLGNSVRLPYLLAGGGVALAVAGCVLRARQVDVASVLLLAAAHVTYYIFLWLPKEGFLFQEHYFALTLFLALFTYVGAYLWERYLHRFADGSEWEHHVTASLPYLAATMLLATLIQHTLAPAQVPAITGAIGVALLLVGLFTGYVGVKASGLLALGVATVWFYEHLYTPEAPLVTADGFFPYFCGFVATFAGAERAFAGFKQRETGASCLEDAVRTVLVAAGILVAGAGLLAWTSEDWLIVSLFVFAVITMAFGFLVREPRYRWGALCVFGVALLRAFLFLDSLSPTVQVITFGAAGVLLLGVSWFYARLRRSSPTATKRRMQPPTGGENTHRD